MGAYKELILEQLRACHNQDGWFAPLHAALRRVTAEQATEGGAGASNSIYGIVRHLVFWNQRYLQRFTEGKVAPLEITNTETFENNGRDGIVENWDELQNMLDGLLTQWEEAVAAADDAKLESRIHPDKDEVWWETLAHLTIHNAYHIGQLVHIRKHQGHWEPWE